MADLAVVILAAGKGTRMKSRMAKVLHTLAGRPMVRYAVDLAKKLGAHPIVVVVGHDGSAVKEALEGEGLTFVTQEPQLGTGHALGFARRVLRSHKGEMVILCGDVPLLQGETVRRLVAHHRAKGAALTALVGRLDDPSGYGRILRDSRGRVLRVVEERDATKEERAIRDVNAGIYCAEHRALFKALETLQRDNAQGEYYLTDAVEALAAKGVAAYPVKTPEEFMGINDRVDLAHAEKILRQRLRHYWMREGVTLRDPGTAYLDSDVRIGRDTVLGPQVALRGRTVIGEGCEIGAGCILQDSVLEDGVVVLPYSVIEQSRVETGAVIGPFAHVRPDSQIGAGARIGNFVEVKKSRIGRNAKAAHLTYLGDAEVGAEVNIGAGTITCNYDGFAKHPTVIEEGAFVGSDTQFIAPVRVGRGAVVGAGSTITEDVPPGALAVARAQQVNLPERGYKWTRKRRKRK